MRRLNTVLLTATLLGSAFAVLPTTSPASAAGPPRCAGERATIVGDPGQGTLKGTRGSDVIVTNGQLRTDAGRGRDLVCVTGGGRQWIKAGDGDDRILVPTSRQVGVEVLPGDGDDLVRGGAGDDFVEQHRSHGRDTLRLGRGDDEVAYEGRGRFDNRSADRVALGTGDDRVRQFIGTLMPIGAAFDGGPGLDELWLAAPPEISPPVSKIDVDMTAGTVRVDDGRVQVPGVDRIELYASRSARVTYLGTAADDYFASNPSPVSADMLGGDDELVLRGTDHEGSVYDGGSGTDLLGFGAGAQSVTADLTAGAATVLDEDVTEEYSFGAFEDLRAQVWDALRITGSAGPNRLVVDGCDVEVSAGAGDDVVRWQEVYDVTDYRCPVGSPGARLQGEDGDDRLASGELDDTIIGGPGTDIAVGGEGTDHCEAESRSDCES